MQNGGADFFKDLLPICKGRKGDAELGREIGYLGIK